MNSLLRAFWNLMFSITGIDVSFDAKYKDWSFYLIELRANYQGVKELLAERNLIPKEIVSGETRLQIVGCEMRAVQIAGPYNEVSIQVPVNPLDDSSGDKFAHLFLPVSTEVARWPGVDIYGFPKFVAKIDFASSENQFACKLAIQDEAILEFGLDNKIGTKKQERWEYYGNRNRRIIKTVFDFEGMIGEWASKQNANFLLGRHVIADTLRELVLSDQVVRTMIGQNLSGVLRKPVLIKP